MDYKDIFSPETIGKMNSRSAENLRRMLGDKTLMQTLISSGKLLQEIMELEKPYIPQLEELSIQMIEDMYPIVIDDNIKLDAKIVSMNDVNQSLDEIKINKPGNKLPLFIEDGYNDQPYFQLKDGRFFGHYFEDKVEFQDVGIEYDELLQYLKDKHIKYTESGEFIFIKKEDTNIQGPLNENTPESKRRVINGITQGAALKGTFSFYMFKEYLDAIDPTLVEKYNQLMKEVFGVYDDPNAIAMFLQQIAMGNKMGGGSSKVVVNEIKINPPTNYKKAYAECHSYEEYVKYGKQGDHFVINKETNKILASFKAYNIGRWVDKLTTMNPKYQRRSYNMMINPPDWMEDPTEINPDDPNNWNNSDLTQLINKYQPVNEIKINKPNTIQGLIKNNGDYDYIDTDVIRDILIKKFPYESKQIGEYIYDIDIDDLESYENPNIIDIINDYKLYKKHSLEDLNEQNQKGVTIRARALRSPMLVNEIKINKPTKIFDINNFNIDDLNRLQLGDYIKNFNGDREKIKVKIKNIIKTEEGNLYNLTKIYNKKTLNNLGENNINEIKINKPDFGFNGEERIALNKLKNHFKNVEISQKLNPQSQGNELIQYISFTTKNGYNINFIKRTQNQKEFRNPGSNIQIYGDYGFLLGGSLKMEGSLKQLVDYSIKKYKTTKPLNESEQKSTTIRARAICFPMLVHELIKGLYELVSLQGFQGTKDQNQAVADKVDKLEHEPEDIKYGQQIFEALNDIYVDSGFDDQRIREFFFADVYQMGDQEFIEFIENAINGQLTPTQSRWVNTTLKEISIDLRDDDYDDTGLDEIRIRKPNDSFSITPTGKEKLRAFAQWLRAGEVLEVSDAIHEVNELTEQYPFLWDLLNLYIYSDIYGENLIKINNINDINLLHKNFQDRFGEENDASTKRDIQSMMRGWLENKYITNIKI